MRGPRVCVIVAITAFTIGAAACGGSRASTPSPATGDDSGTGVIDPNAPPPRPPDAGPLGTQEAYIKASNPRRSAFFGAAALSADGTTLAVGAYGDSSAATGIDNQSPGQADTSATRAG